MQLFKIEGKVMNSYIRISNELYREFEKAFKKEKECQVVYLDKSNQKVSMSSKILDLLSVDGSEYMNMASGLKVRLDKIITFNGEDTKYLNHY